MATYVGLIQFADQGIRNIKDTVKRGEAAIAEAEKMGMKIVEDRTVRAKETREPEGEPMKRAKEERNGGPSGKRGHRVPPGGVWLSEEREHRGAPKARFKPSPGRARWQSLLGRRTV